MEVRKILRIRFFFPPQSSEPMIRITDDFLQSVNLEKRRGRIVAKACCSLICRFLVIANGMAACYSLLQGARCLMSILTGGVLISRPMAWAIFSCDQASIYNYHERLL